MMALAADRRENAVDIARTRTAIRGAYDDLDMWMSIYAAISRRTAVDSLAARVRRELGVDVR